MDFDYSPRTQELQQRLLAFMDAHVYPAEVDYEAELESNTKAGRRWTPLETIEKLKPKAREQGLWNLFLPPTAGGKGAKSSRRDIGLSNGDYAPLAEIMGRVPWASEIFNCSAPDTGNMEMLSSTTDASRVNNRCERTGMRLRWACSRARAPCAPYLTRETSRPLQSPQYLWKASVRVLCQTTTT